MGKNRKGNPKNKELGRCLIKDRNLTKVKNRTTLGKDTWRHTSDIQDGYEWNRINLQSITEQDTLDEFLNTAEMAGAEFTAEKLNIKIVGSAGIGEITGVLGEAEKTRIKELHEEHRQFITIPRRPVWDESTTPEELQSCERESFLNWRRGLAQLKETQQLLLTPYEMNLDVWRQLWRVIERSDVVCQIVDGRNPLLYKCDDLEVYVKEVDPTKEYIVLINKADYLTENQRMCWLEYFTEKNTKVIFWSALEELTSEEDIEIETADSASDIGDNSSESDNEQDNDCDDNDNNNGDNDKVKLETASTVEENTPKECSPVELYNRKKLLSYFRTFHKVVDNKKFAMIGLVGYPNVGKSSTINALVQEKLTAVSATPGKTKHFQTHFIDEELCLCDCPGLVFPSFVSTKAHLILSGILPVDHLRDHISPLNLLAQYIERKVIESTYGINIVKPSEMEDPNRPPTAEEMLSSYAKMRGYMTSSGQPDCPRASRYVIKDYLKGKLLYCHPPPGIFARNFEQSQASKIVLDRILKKEEKESNKPPDARDADEFSGMKISSIDGDFFRGKEPVPHYNAPTGASNGLSTNPDLSQVHKPWKKHNNRNKKREVEAGIQRNL